MFANKDKNTSSFHKMYVLQSTHIIWQQGLEVYI